MASSLELFRGMMRGYCKQSTSSWDNSPIISIVCAKVQKKTWIRNTHCIAYDYRAACRYFPHIIHADNLAWAVDVSGLNSNYVYLQMRDASAKIWSCQRLAGVPTIPMAVCRNNRAMLRLAAPYVMSHYWFNWHAEWQLSYCTLMVILDSRLFVIRHVREASASFVGVRTVRGRLMPTPLWKFFQHSVDSYSLDIV